MYKCPLKLAVVYQHIFLIKIGFRPCIFIVNYLSLYVLKKFWFKLHEDGDNAENMSQPSNRKIHNCRIVHLSGLSKFQHIKIHRMN